MKKLSHLRAVLCLTIVATLPAVVLCVARPGVSERAPTGISKSAVDAPRGDKVSSATPDAAKPRVMRDYGNLPLSFEANRGQTDRRVKFLSRGHGYTLFLTPNEAVLALSKSPPQAEPPDPSQARLFQREKTVTTALRIKLVGGNPRARVAGTEEFPGKSNYFIGNDPKKWRTNVPNFGRVKVRDVYPGVDLMYYGNQRQLEEDFMVAPGADPRAITMEIAGTTDLSIDAQGELVMASPGGEVHLRKPVIYQRAGGVQHEIAGGYKLKGENRVGFELGEYDVGQPLVIDPVLAYSTYLGGSSDDEGFGIAVDSSGNAYVTGYTTSTDFPGAGSSPIQSANAGGPYDAFVAKINAAGSALVYSTYLGGSGWDVGYGIAVDSSGNAYVAGTTASSDFPGASSSPIQSAFAGGPYDAFVAKIDAAGSALVYSTYLGGNSREYGQGIAVDSSGNAYVTGYTGSTDFPVASPIQSANAGSNEAFVAKIDAAGNALVYSTYLGGGSVDVGLGIAVDSSGNAYVTGFTYSPDFPGAGSSPIQSALAGGYDAFVAKIGNLFNFVGFLTPIINDSVCAPNLPCRTFKLGSTVPVKFQLFDVNNVPVGTAVATIAVVQISGSSPGTTPVDLGTGAANTGNQFRFDATSNQYIFNLSTRVFAPGVWRIDATVSDGTVHSVEIGLR